MTFLHPEFLYYLLPPLTMVYLFILMQKESHDHYFSKEIINKLRVNSNSLTLKTRNSLLFLAGLLIILASAEPVLKDGKIRVKAIGGDILIALDISDSMLASDVYPNRLELAKKKALELIDKTTKDRVGVIAFAKNSYLVSPISFDTKTVSFLLSKLDTSSITQKGTDILTMLKTVVKTNTSTDKKYLLILSDGSDDTDFSAEINFAKENGVIVFVLGIGTELGTSIKKKDGSLIKYNDKVIISKLNESISELAIHTGGVYIQNTTSSQDVEAMFSEIISNSEHKELKSQEIERYVALFYYPIILAILILLIAFNSISKRVEHNIPASAFILFFMILSSTPSVADILDFRKLADAKKSYDAKDYNSSAKIYDEYARKTNNAEAYYNAGNSYYKEKQYIKALSAYSFARLEDNKELRAKKLSNMGNALARLGTINTLERAIKHYEVSLRLKEDQFTRENLEAVKKALEENKKKEEKEDGQKDKDKKYSQQKTDESGDASDEADDKNNKNKNQKNKNKNNSEGKKTDNKVNPNSKKNSDDSKSDENEGNNNDGSNNDNDNDESQEKVRELKDKNKKEVKNQGNSGKSNLKLQQMSDLEEAKWVKKLNSKQNTYLYRLNKEMIENEEKNEKPW
ncbi:VWA domain-containing protein [Sulfurimonas sp.]|uniref:VWA domain-containing protein n=1 Tax=Sulfurimonas sp. TaxID=2022749 RepID=UPI00356A7EB7